MHPLIPSQLKIGNRNVPVSFEQTEDGVMGFYDLSNPRIVLNPNMSPLATVETFWHELMHAIFDYTRFNIDMQMELDDNDSVEVDAMKIEERSAESFAKVLLQVIQDNDIANITT